MSKIILNFIMSVSVLLMTVLVMTFLLVTVYPACAFDAAGTLEQIHAGTAWDAYNSGNLDEAERQFQLLIDKEKNRAPDTNTTVQSEELMNLELGLAYTRTKLASLISSKEITSSSEAIPFLSSSKAMPASSKKLLISSKELFADLIRKKYKLTDCVPAILGILSQLKDYKTMDEYLPILETLFSGQDLDKWDYLFAESAWVAYNAKNYQIARKKFETLLQKHIIQKNLNGTINPDTKSNPDTKNNPDATSLVTGLGYTLYQQEKYDSAYELLNDFIGKHNIKNTPEITELKLMICRKLADPLASKVKKGKYGVFNGYDNIFHHRHKNGDDGTSRLDETGVSVSLNNPQTLPETDFNIFLRTRYLSNGKNGRADGTSFNSGNIIGSFYRSLNGQQTQTSSSNIDVMAHQAFIKFETWKSFIPFKLGIITGISPAGGAVDPTPLFNVTAVRNGWKAEIHRLGVDDSILSISGLEDPYSDADLIHSREWGRVVKNGMTLGNNLSFGKNSWFSVNGSFDAYRGLNVWQNTSYQLNAASGKTIAMQNRDEMTLGVYATWTHFDHNSNFYTFGHGGYYSPDMMISAGPLFRYKTSSCRDYRMDFQLSLGWMKEKNADTPKYPIHYEVVDEFTESAFDELKGIYVGDTSSGMTGSIKIEGWKIMTDHLAANGFFSMNAASEELEWRIGAGIEYSFDVRSGFK